MSEPPVTTTTQLDRVLGKAAHDLGKHLELYTVGDLLAHYPRTYLEHGEVSEMGDLEAGQFVSLQVTTTRCRQFPYTDKRSGKPAWRLEVAARLSDGEIWMTFFDRTRHTAVWREKRMAVGTSVLATGRFERNSYKQDRWELVQPSVEDVVDDREIAPRGLRPIYRVGAGVQSHQLERAVAHVLTLLEPLEATIEETLPGPVLAERHLISLAQATRWIHQPDDHRQAGAAAKRLRLDEALTAQVALAQRRLAATEVTTQARPGALNRPQSGLGSPDQSILAAFDAACPFILTEGQNRVCEEIFVDLAKTTPMRRLLQGEVGSGKTVVALRAMLQVIDSGGQAALLAPTEVLAQQHARSLAQLLGPLAAADLLGAADAATKIALLTGSMSTSARRVALSQAASGEAGIVVGTHALIQGSVSFADLGLVVVDEQHRFGVEQRAALGAKGLRPPHELVMTATPIPRTIAITVFGDLEVSALRELPAGRSAIDSVVVPLRDQPAWSQRVWARVREEVANGHQVYVVCPRITSDEVEKSESSAAVKKSRAHDRGTSSRDAAAPLAAVEDVAAVLTAGPLQDLRVAALHGQQTPEVKEATMAAYGAGTVDVLISTTVIEVGVDVANATAMVILDADRFGVSQLHQLRGRVGRGGHKGLCLLVTNASAGSPARTRLEAVAATSDGFELADLDLELRREGDVLGTRQSGSQSTLRLLSVRRDLDVIEEARVIAAGLIADDPQLTALPALAEAVSRMSRGDRVDFLDKS